MTTINVLIADDHAIVREGARQLLAAEADMNVVGVAEHGDEVLTKARSLRPDVLVLDISMPGLSGLELVPLIRRALPATQVIVLSIHQKEAFVQQVLSSGAKGYVLKTAPIEDLISGIRAVFKDEYYLSAKVEAAVIGIYAGNSDPQPLTGSYDSLTEREQLIFRMVVQGKSSKNIAELLCLSPRTVEKHRASALQKLDLRSPLERVKYAIKLGIIDPDDPDF